MLIDRKRNWLPFDGCERLRIAQQSTERCNTQLTLRYVLSFPSIYSSTGQCTSHAVLPYRSVLRLASAAPTAGEMTETKFIWKRERKEKCRGRDKAGEQDLTRPTTRVTFVLSLFLFFLKGGWANRFLSTIPTLKRTRVYKTKSKTKSKTSKWIKISNWYGRKTWTVVKFLKRWKRMDDILRQKILFF